MPTNDARLCECGKKVRVGGTQCTACYMRTYRKTKNGQKATKLAHKRWRTTHANYWDREYKREWRRRTHRVLPPEVRDLRKALKRLERAMAEAEDRA